MRAGALRLAVEGGSVRQLRPHAFQVVNGKRRAVDSGYTVRGDRVSIRLGAYDQRLPLTIDPTLAYSTYLGGLGDDSGTGSRSTPQGPPTSRAGPARAPSRPAQAPLGR
jgi:hypothetical protein